MRAEAQTGASVELDLRSRQEFLAGYDNTFSNGGVFCPTRGKAVKGAPAVVTVNLGRRQPPLVLVGRVAWRRPGRHLQKIRAGICIEFLPSEKPKIDYLMDLAKAGDTVRSRRRHERLPVDVPVNWHTPGAAAPARGRPARHRSWRRLHPLGLTCAQRCRGGARAFSARRPGCDGVHRPRGLDRCESVPMPASASNGAHVMPAAANASASWFVG